MSRLLAEVEGGAVDGSLASLCFRLAAATPGREKEVGKKLREAVSGGSVLLNRPSASSEVAPSDEARHLVAWLRAHERDAIALHEGVARFAILTREVGISRLDNEVDAYPEIERTFLLDYPLAAPFVFRATSSLRFEELADVIADAYARIYEEPEAYGVFGHDRSDLVIERLSWFAEKNLIYPSMGS